LPRPVGVASEDELFCAGINLDSSESDDDTSALCKGFLDSINAQLPGGCEMFAAELCQGKCSPRPRQGDYEFAVKNEFADTLDGEVSNLSQRLSSGDVMVERKIDARGRTKMVNVGAYIKSLAVSDCTVSFACEITSSGSARPDEILGLLNVDADMLAGPMVRKKVEWQKN